MYFLAGDIGGSKTKIVIYNEKYNCEKTYELPGAGFSVESNNDIPFLREAFISISKEFKISCAAINLGGKNTCQITNIFKNIFHNVKFSIYRESEGTSAIELGKIYNDRIILLAGTGTIGIGFTNDNKYIISGGWGANIGDEGSGYAIGLTAIHESLEAIDGITSLSPMQCEITGISNPIKITENVSDICKLRDKVRMRLSPLDRSHIASLTKTVSKYAKIGESDSIEILENAGLEMAKLVLKINNKLSPFCSNGVVVAGGLVNILPFWQNKFETYIKSYSKITKFDYVVDGVSIGTYEIAKKLFNER